MKDSSEEIFGMPTTTNGKGVEVLTSDMALVKGMEIPTIADRGTSADIVSMDVARRLLQEGVVKEIQSPTSRIFIQFGIKSATIPVVGIIYGRGLLGRIYVVDSVLSTMLISDITFTQKGVILIEDNSHLIGIAGGEIVLVGVRDPMVPRTDSKAMWRLDIRALLLQEDPQIRMQEEERQHNQSAWDIVSMLGIDSEEARAGSMSMEQHQCYGAKPRSECVGSGTVTWQASGCL